MGLAALNPSYIHPSCSATAAKRGQSSFLGDSVKISTPTSGIAGWHAGRGTLQTPVAWRRLMVTSNSKHSSMHRIRSDDANVKSSPVKYADLGAGMMPK